MGSGILRLDARERISASARRRRRRPWPTRSWRAPVGPQSTRRQLHRLLERRAASALRPPMKVTAPSAVHAGAYEGSRLIACSIFTHRRRRLVQPGHRVAEQDVRGRVRGSAFSASSARVAAASNSRPSSRMVPARMCASRFDGSRSAGARVLPVGIHQIAAVLIRAPSL